FFAGAFDVVGWSGCECVDARVGIVLTNVARCAQIVFKHPGFDVEAVWIDRAVRTFETDRQAPALTGGVSGHLIDVDEIARLRKPGEREALRNDRIGCFDAFDGEGEARAAWRCLRQFIDYAYKRNVDAFPFVR